MAIQGTLGGGTYQQQQVASTTGAYLAADFQVSLADGLQTGMNSVNSSASMTSIAEMPIGDYGTVFALGNAGASYNTQPGTTAAGLGTSTFDMTLHADSLFRLFLTGTHQLSGTGNVLVRLAESNAVSNPIFDYHGNGQAAGNFIFNELLMPGDYRWQAVASAPVSSSAPPASSTARFQFSGVLGNAADLNLDARIDCVDIDALVAEIAAGTNQHYFDLTGDGLVNLDDRDLWLSVAGAVLNPSHNPLLVGDANLDGVVDGQDFIQWNIHKFESTPAWCHGDFNADGVVDGQDFIEWNVRKFMASAGTPSAPVPEVTACGLLSAYLCLTLVLRGCYRQPARGPF